MTTPIARLFFAALLVNAAFDAVRVAMSYRVLALGGDAVSVGIVAATFALLPMVLALQIGRYGDRRGSWGILTAGTVLSTAAVGLAAVSSTIVALAVANTALGLGQVMTMIGAQGFIMALTERKKHVNGFAMFTLAVSVGQSIGTPIVGVLLTNGRHGDVVDTDMALIVMTVVAAAAIPIVLSLPRTKPIAKNGDSSRPVPLHTLVRRTGMVPAIFAGLIVVTGVDLITAYMPVVGESIGLSPLVVSALVSTRSVSSMISRAAMPWLLQHRSQTAILIASPIITAPAVFALGISSNVVVLGLSLMVIGFLWGMNQPVTMNWVTVAAPSSDRVAALALRLTGNRAAQLAIPLGAGAIAGVAGPGSVFLIAGALTVAAAASTATSLRWHPVPEFVRASVAAKVSAVPEKQPK